MVEEKNVESFNMLLLNDIDFLVRFLLLILSASFTSTFFSFDFCFRRHFYTHSNREKESSKNERKRKLTKEVEDARGKKRDSYASHTPYSLVLPRALLCSLVLPSYFHVLLRTPLYSHNTPMYFHELPCTSKIF